MKKSVLLITGILISIACFSQDKTKTVYCEIVGHENLMQLLKGKANVVINIDYGQVYEDSRMVDESGKTVKYNSMIDAMNKLAEDGWEFKFAYVITQSSTSNVYHWLLAKEVAFDEDVEFNTKGAVNRAKKEQPFLASALRNNDSEILDTVKKELSYATT